MHYKASNDNFVNWIYALFDFFGSVHLRAFLPRPGPAPQIFVLAPPRRKKGCPDHPCRPPTDWSFSNCRSGAWCGHLTWVRFAHLTQWGVLWYWNKCRMFLRPPFPNHSCQYWRPDWLWPPEESDPQSSQGWGFWNQLVTMTTDTPVWCDSGW